MVVLLSEHVRYLFLPRSPGSSALEATCGRGEEGGEKGTIHASMCIDLTLNLEHIRILPFL